MNKICFGCGAKLQSVDKESKGYIPEGKINTASYCMRCFRMMHYGEQQEMTTPKDKKEIINKVNKDHRFVIFLVDFLNINDEVMTIFKSITRPKLLIVNKCELLPKDVNKLNFLKYLQDYYHIDSEIKLKGSNSFHGIKPVLHYLEENNIMEMYVLGISNSGKSTFINDFIDVTKTDMAKINVNKRANTTLDFIRVKLANGMTLIDSPGFIIDNFLDNTTSSKTIVSYTMQMKECETIALFDNKYYFKFDAKTSVVLYANQSGKKIVKKYYKAAPDLVTKIDIVKDNQDIVLKGNGFLTVKKPCTVTCNIPASFLEVRDSMFGGYKDEQNSSNE